MPRFADKRDVNKLSNKAFIAGVPAVKVLEIIEQHKHHGTMMDRDMKALENALDKAAGEVG